jgi:hypothetical protein
LVLVVVWFIFLPLATATPDSMSVTAASKKRKQKAAASSNAAAKKPANVDVSTEANKSDPLTSYTKSRALSVAPHRTINVQEIHNVTSLYVFRAFGLRNVVEKVHRNSISLIRRNVIRRLEYTNDYVEQNQKSMNQLDERLIRKLTRIMQETLDYLKFYMEKDGTNEDDENIDIYVAGIETLHGILVAAEHLRLFLFEKGGCSMLVELLRRHDHLLRSVICNVLMLCFLPQSSNYTEFMKLSASDRSYNRGFLNMIVREDCWSAIVKEDLAHWDMRATETTTTFLMQLSHLIADRHIGLYRLAEISRVVERMKTHSFMLYTRVDAGSQF